MSEFQELLASDHQKTLQFFYEAIKDNLPKEADTLPQADLVHCATIMASYAQTSVGSSSAGMFPVSMSLHEFYDVVVMDRSNFSQRPEDQVGFGSQLLFLSGFFRDQLSRRHNIEWYIQLGASFYALAARGYLKGHTEADFRRADFCYRMHKYFDFWGHTFHRVSRSFRDNQYDPRLIRVR
jgi:hypothetical protein